MNHNPLTSLALSGFTPEFLEEIVNLEKTRFVFYEKESRNEWVNNQQCQGKTLKEAIKS